MEFIRYLPLAILLFFSIKLLISFIDNRIANLNDKIELKKIEKGMLSIKDLQKDNYNRFITTVNSYLEIHNYKSIDLIPNGNSEVTEIKATLNEDAILVSCTQNNCLSNDSSTEDSWESTSRPHVQRFIARIVSSNCKKGVLINNSLFTKEAIDFVEDFNSKNLNIEIKLVDGYELTRSIRNYNNYLYKVEFSYEN